MVRIIDVCMWYDDVHEVPNIERFIVKGTDSTLEEKMSNYYKMKVKVFNPSVLCDIDIDTDPNELLKHSDKLFDLMIEYNTNKSMYFLF